MFYVARVELDGYIDVVELQTEISNLTYYLIAFNCVLNSSMSILNENEVIHHRNYQSSNYINLQLIAMINCDNDIGTIYFSLIYQLFYSTSVILTFLLFAYTLLFHR